MNLGRWLISLSLLLFSMSASAEYYRYIGKDGNVHYTDDLTNVPENQRTDIQEYTGFQGDPDDQQKDEQKDEQPIEKEQVKNKPDINDFSEIKKRLDQEKEKLDEEYRALMEEKKRSQKTKTNIDQKVAPRNITKLYWSLMRR